MIKRNVSYLFHDDSASEEQNEISTINVVVRQSASLLQPINNGNAANLVLVSLVQFMSGKRTK